MPTVVAQRTCSVPHVPEATRQPCFFWNHGPGGGIWARFIQDYGASLRVRPRAVLVIEAHFEADPIAISAGPITSRVKELLKGSGIRVGDTSNVPGHGFSDVQRAFPNTPVVCLSVHRSQDAAMHVAIGAALAPLRDEGIAIIGSGYADYHNFGLGFGQVAIGHSHAFSTFLRETLTASSLSPQQRLAKITQWQGAPSARVCHPVGEAEHLMPLLVCAGAGLGECATLVQNHHRRPTPSSLSFTQLEWN